MSIILHRPTQNESETCKLHDGNPQLFLAGPIMGARDWQRIGTAMLPYFLPQGVDVHVSNPRWDTVALEQKLGKSDQRTWEKNHYRAALAAGHWGTKGVMAFYLPAESHQTLVPNPPGRAYAQGTRSEFSEAVGAHLFAPHEVDIVLGMGVGFQQRGHGLHEYHHTAEELGLQIQTGLSATLRAATEILLAQQPKV